MIIPEHFLYVLYIVLSTTVSVCSSVYIFSIFYFGRKKERDNHSKNTGNITILIPVYNEDVGLFNRCISSVKKQSTPFIVIGNGCNLPYRKIVEGNGGRFIYLRNNAGKKGALAEGIKRVNSEYVMLLDSDTVIPKNAARRLIQKFDTDTGGVGAEIKIIKDSNKFVYYPSEMLQRLRQLSFKAMSHFGRVLVLNGQCAVYRTGLIRDFILSREFLEPRFLGKKMVIGDDILLTKHINGRGYRTILAQDVIARTKGQGSFKKLVKQSIRWSRSGYINFIKGIRDWSLFKNGFFYSFSMVYVYTLPVLTLFLMVLRGGLLFNIIVRRGILNGGRLFILSFTHIPRILNSVIFPYAGIKIISILSVITMIYLIIEKTEKNRVRFLSYGSVILLVMFLTAIYAVMSLNNHDKWLTR